MKSRHRRAALGLLAGAAALALAMPGARADDWPAKPITIIVGYSAGGGTDTLVRAMAEPMAKALGQQILVQNAPGAGGGVAAVRVANAEADGYTLLATTSSTFSLEPQIQKTAYANDQFVHVATIAQFQGAMFANIDKPFNSLPELIALAKKEGRAVKFATFFQVDKLLMTYIGKKEGVEMVPVPVKGGSGAVQAVLAGDVDIAYSGGSWAPQVKSGAAKTIFATSHDRLALAPDLVAMKDLGYDIGTTSYLTISAPAGTPQDRVAKIAAALEQAVGTELAKSVGEKRFMDVAFKGPDGTKDIIDTETAAFAEMIEAGK